MATVGDRHRWWVHSLFWFGQTTVASLLVLLGLSGAGMWTNQPPLVVFAGVAAVLGPPLLLRQAALLVAARTAGE